MSADIPSGKAFRQPKSTALKIDNRVQVNQDRLRGIGKLISRLSDQTPYNFVDSTVPPLNHSLTIDFFFVTTLQQFSFWTIKDDRYHLPLIDTIGGEELKGSAYLYKAYNQKIDSDPDYFSVGRQSNQTLAEMLELFRSDNGVDVMPAVELHLAASHRYGNSMRKLGWTPEDILIAAS